MLVSVSKDSIICKWDIEDILLVEEDIEDKFEAIPLVSAKCQSLSKLRSMCVNETKNVILRLGSPNK